jgi:pSer/pThr/pTyr-binding forkhead associated (FHA) protein
VRFEVKYPESPPHEAELQGTLAVLGRDPSCDLVLNDVKCSRRHAVVEAGPDGIAIRDTGSANGVYLNGKKIERASLQPGDVVGLGDVILTVLAEDVPGTLVMGPEEAAQLEPDSTAMISADAFSRAVNAPSAPPPRHAPPPPLPAMPPPAPPPVRAPALSDSAATPPFPGPLPASNSALTPPYPSPPLVGDGGPPPPLATVAAAPVRRPLTVSILAALWAASVLLYGVGAVASLVGQSGIVAFLGAALCGMLALVSGGMAFGLYSMKPWARIAQIVVAGLGVLTCAYTLASAVTLFYLLRDDAKARFANPEPRPPDPREGIFAAALLGTVVLGALGSIGIGVFSAIFGGNAAVPGP